MLDPTSLILIHTVMMWTIALSYWLIVFIEKRWGFPWQWALGFTLMPLVMLIGGWAEHLGHDGLRALGFIVGIAGPLILVDGLRVFVRQPPPVRLWMAVLPAYLFGIVATTFIYPSLQYRIVIFLVTVIIGSGYGIALLRYLPMDDHTLGKPLALVTSIFPMLLAGGLGAAILAGALGDPATRLSDAGWLIVAATVTAVLRAMDQIVLVAERMAAKIGRDARIDVLTGLATRRVFDQALQRELARHQRSRRPLSVILFDVDYFKAINDTHGHDVGDAALQKVAEIARSALRPSDLAARLGGDEFAILLPETDPHAAESVAQRILSGMRSMVLEVPSGVVRLTGSFGIGASADGLAAPELVKRADDALYQVKRQGRNGVAALA